MKKRIIIVVSLVVLAAASYWTYQKFHPEADIPEVQPVYVQAQAVKKSAMPMEASAIGTLSARTVDITPEIGGHVAKVDFKDGAFVKRGATLIQLDDAVYRAKYNSAKAQLVYSQGNYERMTMLGKQNAVSKQAIDQADADLKEKLANAQETEVMLNKQRLVAPFDGVVSKSKVNRGDYVNVAQAVVSITDTYHLHVDYNVPEKYLPLLKLGQQVVIRSNTYPDQEFHGVVAYISPTVNADNRTVSLYAEIPNEGNLLASGMFVEVAQSLGKQDKVIVVPARALVPVIDGAQIYKVVDNKAFPVSVTTGKRLGENIQILQGLSVGDVVITDGQMKVRNGTPVKIKT